MPNAIPTGRPGPDEPGNTGKYPWATDLTGSGEEGFGFNLGEPLDGTEIDEADRVDYDMDTDGEIGDDVMTGA